MVRKITYLLPLLLLTALISCQEHVPATEPEPLNTAALTEEDVLLKEICKPCDPGVLKVMTRNIYVGGDVDIVIEAEDPQMIPFLVAEVYAMVQQTNFYERAVSLAREIKLTRPHLIGLQEISTIYRQSPGDQLNYMLGIDEPPTSASEEDIVYNYLDILLNALSEAGMDYRPVAIGQNADVEMPMATMVVGDQLAAYDDIRLIDFDVILARHDVQIVGEPLVVPYSVILQVPPEDPQLIVPRGFVSVVASIGNQTLRFVSTHLEAPLEAEPIRFAQAMELRTWFENETLPVIIVGDFNAPAPTNGTYQSMIEGGYQDAWLENPHSHHWDGLTFGHDPDLLNPVPDFTERLDFIFHRSNQPQTTIKTGPVVVLGDEEYNRTASGLWPSDHGGVVAKLHLEAARVAHN